MVGNRFGNRALMHRPAFGLIGGEQARSAPTSECRRQLPAKIDGVGDAEVHAVAAVGRMQMARIAGEEYAFMAVLVGDETVRRPHVPRQNLEIDLPADRGPKPPTNVRVVDLLHARRK